MAGAYLGRGLHGQTVETIGARIVRGDYAPGATLLADGLEAELGVSKTVVRETLKVLAAKGLVESRQKRGTIVRARQFWNLLDGDVLRWQADSEPDFEFLDDVAEVRGIVEPAGARLAALRRDDTDLAELDAALQAMASAGANVEAAVAADVRFHRAVLNAAHNPILAQLEVMLATGLQVRDRFVHNSRRPSDSLPAHRALLEAIRDKDPELAARTVNELLIRAARDLDRAQAGARGSKPATRSTRRLRTGREGRGNADRA